MTLKKNSDQPPLSLGSIVIRGSGGLVLVLLLLLWWESAHHYEGKSLEQWLAVLGQDRSELHSESLAALHHYGVRALPRLLEMLDQAGTGNGRDWLAVRAFKVLGEQASPAIPELAKRMNAGNQSAAIALGHIGEPAVPVLVKALGQTNRVAPPNRFGQSQRGMRDINYGERIPQSAMHALMQIGASAHAAVPALVGVVGDQRRNPWSRQQAVWALGAIGKEPGQVVPVLLSVLKHNGTNMPVAAAQALQSFSSATNQTVPELLAVLKNNQFDAVQRAAGDTLVKLGAGKETVSVLLKRMEATDAETRAWAADTLGRVCLEPAIAVPALASLLDDTNAAVRVAAARTLGGYCPRSSNAVTQSLRALNDADRSVVTAAMHGLGGLGPEWSTDPEFYADCALRRLGSFRNWRQELSDLSRAPDPKARRFAIWLLDSFAPVK